MIRGLLLLLGFVGAVQAAEPSRIAALGLDVEETVTALGRAGDVVAVVEGHGDFPKAAKVGTHRQVATEPILSTRPDVVVAGGSVGPAEVLEAVAGAGVPVTRLDKPTDLDGVRANIRVVAAAVGAADKAAGVIASLDATIAGVDRVGPEVRVAFVYARGAGTMMLAGKGTGIRTVIEATGATAVGDWDGFRPITDEALVQLKPTHVLVTTGGLMSLGGEETLRRLTPFALLGPSLKLVHLDDRLVLSTGPRIADAIAALAGQLKAAR